MCGAIPPLPNTPSWHGDQLKNTGTTLSLPLACSQTPSISVLTSVSEPKFHTHTKNR
jgi:hypothetical protein